MKDLTGTLVPFDLVKLVCEDAQAFRKPTGPAGVAVAKCASNKGAARYAPFKDFFDNMTPLQRVTLCRLVDAEIKFTLSVS